MCAEIVFLDSSAAPPALPARPRGGVNLAGVFFDFVHWLLDEPLRGSELLEFAIDRFRNRKGPIIHDDSQDSNANFLQTFFEPFGRFAPGGIRLHDEDDPIRQLSKLSHICSHTHGRRVDENVVELSSQFFKLDTQMVGIQRNQGIPSITAASNDPEIAEINWVCILSDGKALHRGFE